MRRTISCHQIFIILHTPSERDTRKSFSKVKSREINKYQAKKMGKWEKERKPLSAKMFRKWLCWVTYCVLCKMLDKSTAFGVNEMLSNSLILHNCPLTFNSLILLYAFLLLIYFMRWHWMWYERDRKRVRQKEDISIRLTFISI